MKIEERCDTQPKLVSALETIESVRILNKDKFLGINQPEFPEIAEFCRDLEIEVNGNKYTIVWYKNYSSIRSEFMEAMFDSITLHRPTFPLKADSKLKLQLSFKGQMSVVI